MKLSIGRWFESGSVDFFFFLSLIRIYNVDFFFLSLIRFLSSTNLFRRIQALESDHVSANINSWIDLIFGYKQKGENSVVLPAIIHIPHLTQALLQWRLPMSSTTSPIPTLSTGVPLQTPYNYKLV